MTQVSTQDVVTNANPNSLEIRQGCVTVGLPKWSNCEGSVISSSGVYYDLETRYGDRLKNPTGWSPYAIGVNASNYYLGTGATWDGNNGNVTTVGTNGGPTLYGQFDMGGNLRHLLETPATAGNAYLQGGSWGANYTEQIRTSHLLAATATPSPNSGMRIATLTNPDNLDGFRLVVHEGNSDDGSGYGAVSYQFYLHKFHVTVAEYIVFLNAVAQTDTYALWNTNMAVNANRNAITRSGGSGSYVYTLNDANYANKPVNYLRLFGALRYANWLHNGKPTGLQVAGTTEDGAYTLNGQVTGNAVPRNSGARYFLPNTNEIHKAAYYDGNGGWWNYPRQTNEVPPIKIAATATGDGPYTPY